MGRMEMMKIANHWYEKRKITDDITLIYEPWVHPFLRCNIWHVRGRDKDMLIDTGLGMSSLRSEIAEMIDKPLAAVATHIHYDHVGCLHEFDERIMHRIEAPRMADYSEFIWLKMSDLMEGYQTHGDTSDFDQYLFSRLPYAGFDSEKFTITSTTATRQVEEGDVIDLGDRAFEVLHLPGHSPGSMGLWEATSGTLFSGDAIYDGSLLDELEDSNIAQYIKTMERLRDLPVKVVHGGHEPSFGQSRMRELIDNYLSLRG
tara:strand:+ start:21 stop:797 length:777 start_codon:yes stop_codon:yes gene_type:complete